MTPPKTIHEIVIDKAADLAGIKPEEITAETNLEALGLDSADAVVLAMEVEQVTGREIDVGLFLRCETVADAAKEIAEMVADGGETPDAKASGPDS